MEPTTTLSNELFQEVLLLEDEPAHVLLIERALKGRVGHVVACSTVRAAERELQQRSFDLIISDLNLPDLRSDAVVTALRAHAAGMPLLVLTSSATVADGVAAMRAGASDFLVKNFDATFSDVLHLVLARLREAVLGARERELLARDRDLLREALENSNDGLAVVSSDGHVRYCNTSFEAFLETFQAMNRDLFSISSAAVERGDEVVGVLRERFANLEPGSVWTTEILQPGGGEGAFDLSVSAARHVASERSYVVWAKDIRDRKRREQFQREILSTTTHDLKGPLGAISVSCDVLLGKEGADDTTHALVERISTSANSAIHLIEEFLSLRRIEEGSLILRPVVCDVRAAALRVTEQYLLSAKTRGIELVFDLAQEPVLGCVDPLGFERILSNLISNGVKFTPRGGAVHVQVQRLTDGVSLWVQDSGSGLLPADAQRLFSRYSRLPQHESITGTGLGLFIVKCIVSAHGGVIDLTSGAGKGSTFTIFFPDAPPKNERGEVVCLDFA
jgi:PAS domain S-box-containing protein